MKTKLFDSTSRISRRLVIVIIVMLLAMSLSSCGNTSYETMEMMEENYYTMHLEDVLDSSGVFMLKGDGDEVESMGCELD